MTNTISISKIANPYAEALFQLGLSLYLKENDPQVFFQIIFDMQDLLSLFKTNSVLKEYLANPLIADKDKKDILDKCLNQKASPNTRNFLKLLVDKKRIKFIETITQTFMDKAYAFVCLKFVEVCSTYELTETQQKSLIKKLKIVLGPEFTTPETRYPNITLSLRIDKEILGGFIIKVDSKIIDLSLRGELQQLAKQLDVAMNY